MLCSIFFSLPISLFVIRSSQQVIKNSYIEVLLRLRLQLCNLFPCRYTPPPLPLHCTSIFLSSKEKKAILLSGLCNTCLPLLTNFRLCNINKHYCIQNSQTKMSMGASPFLFLLLFYYFSFLFLSNEFI